MASSAHSYSANFTDQPPKAGLVQAPLRTEAQELSAKLDQVLAQLKPITELFEALSQHPMLKQFLV